MKNKAWQDQIRENPPKARSRSLATDMWSAPEQGSHVEPAVFEEAAGEVGKELPGSLWWCQAMQTQGVGLGMEKGLVK